jgi:hypothetical protein
VQALEAECEAVQRLGSSVDHTNQTLVDNMCDMSGELPARFLHLFFAAVCCAWCWFWSALPVHVRLLCFCFCCCCYFCGSLRLLALLLLHARMTGCLPDSLQA